MTYGVSDSPNRCSALRITVVFHSFLTPQCSAQPTLITSVYKIEIWTRSCPEGCLGPLGVRWAGGHSDDGSQQGQARGQGPNVECAMRGEGGEQHRSDPEMAENTGKRRWTLIKLEYFELPDPIKWTLKSFTLKKLPQIDNPQKKRFKETFII